jgi:putative ABC transport system permease protein
MSLITDLWERGRTILFRGREERELAEELRFHMEMESEQHRRAGMSDNEARRRSALALGGVERTKEDVRDARGTRFWFDGTGDFLYAMRSLARAPGFAITAILTLAIGVGATTAVFSAVDAVLLQPLPYQQPGRLVRLYEHSLTQPSDRGVVSPVYALAYRRQMSSFASIGVFDVYAVSGADIGTGADAHRVRLLQVSADYFDVLRVPPALGHGFSTDDETGAPLVILSHAAWEREMHGDPAVVGRPLMMNGVQYTVVGVMPAGFIDPATDTPDGWVPLDMRPGTDPSNADNHYLSVIARLRPGVTMPQAQSELDQVGIRLGRVYPDAAYSGARLYPLKDDVVGSWSLALTLMLGAVALVLILVCVNVASLMLVRGSDRAREFALRSALGAGRGRLLRQMLVESGALAAAGGLGGVVVARVAMAGIVTVAAGRIPRLTSLALDPRLFVFLLAVSGASALAFGLAPALRAGRVNPRDALSEQSRGATGSRAQMRLRRGLVAAQVALAFVLLVGAGLLAASVQRVRETDIGVQVNGALVFDLNLPGARYDAAGRARLYADFARRVERIPGVTAAGGVSKLPGTGQFNQWGTEAVTGRLAGTRDRFALTENRVVSGNYFVAAGIPVINGRVFDVRDDSAAPNRVVISEHLAKRLFPGELAVGQRLRTGGWTSEIIGVVGNVAINPEGRPDFYVYHAHRQIAGDRNWALTQIVRTARPATAIQSDVHRALVEMDPQLVMYQPMSLAEAVGRGEAQRLFVLELLAAFALTALALAGLGLFGVLSYGVRIRSREFGIRMALGARPGGVRQMVLGEGLRLTAIGVAVGVGGSWLMGRGLQSILFKVAPLDPMVLAGAASFMFAIAMSAAYLPARRATATDPMLALREA